MNNQTTFYLARHAQSFSNVGTSEDFGDGLGSFLTDLGKEQSEKLSEKLKNVEISAVFTSDLNRTRQTAEIIALEKKLNIKTTDTLRERNAWHYARLFKNKTVEEVFKEISNDLKNLNEKQLMQYKHSDRMESVEEAALRLINFLREQATLYRNKTVLVITHGNLLRCLLNYLGYATFNELPAGSIENTGYIVLESNGVDFFIKDVVGVNKQVNAVRNF